jgi:hypothetical protein
MPKKQPPNTSKKHAPARDDHGRLLPGYTANPNGRPLKGYSITETLKEMMAAQPEIKKALGTKLIELALKGDLTAIKLLMSYMDGMPKQEIEQTVVNSTELSLLQHIVTHGQSQQPLPPEQPTDRPLPQSA